MDLTHPIRALAPGLTGAVLEVLAQASHPLTGRAVQRLVSRPASQAGVQGALNRLVDTGLVRQTRAGRALLHRLNRDHALAPAVIEVVRLADTMPDRIAEAVRAQVPGVSRAVLFGSVARREARAESDVDLLLIWPDHIDEDSRWSGSLAIADRVEQLTGNTCLPMVHTESTYEQVSETAPRFARSLAQDAIDLLGH